MNTWKMELATSFMGSFHRRRVYRREGEALLVSRWSGEGLAHSIVRVVDLHELPTRDQWRNWANAVSGADLVHDMDHWPSVYCLFIDDAGRVIIR